MTAPADIPLDYGDPADLARLRTDLRDWLAANPPPPRHPGEPHPARLRRWQRLLYAGGWVGLDIPEAYGGRGLTSLHQAAVADELASGGAPSVPRIGYLSRVLLEFADDGQRATLLPRLLSGEDGWCQGFSEPGAGSDLASLTTRADPLPDGSGYRVTGQKLWTSYAQFSDYCLLLARTDPTAPPHKGITAFALPLDRPGVTVRPLRAANGDDEFCELFLDSAELAAHERIGPEGAGWPVAMTTVNHERNALDTGHLTTYGLLLAELRSTLARRDPAANRDGLRRDVGRCVTDYRVLQAHTRRRTAERLAGVPAGPESSIDKLLMTRTEQRLYETALRVLPEQVVHEGGEVFAGYLYARAASVYGGSSQIQKNILAKRILGLPGA